MADWRCIGPSCLYNGQLVGSGSKAVSGRVTALALDPRNPDTRIYAGTACGGVWRSDDAGAHWKPLMDDKRSLAVGAMAFEPGGDQRLIVGMGECNGGGPEFQGIGVQIYDPDTDVWTLARPLQPLGIDEHWRCGAIHVEMAGAQSHILLGTDQGLWESTNSGVNWTPIALPAGNHVSAITFDSRIAGSEVLLIGIHSNGVYKRVGAAAFTALTDGTAGKLPNTNIGRIELTASTTTPNIVYACLAANDGSCIGIFRSVDGGDSWEKRDNPDMTGCYYKLVMAAKPGASNIVLLGNTKLFRTATTGTNWSHVGSDIHADQHVITFNPVNKDKVWVGNDGGVWFSEDAGENWSPRNRGLATFQYYAIAQHPKFANIVLAGSQDNGVQRYEGAAAWNKVDGGDGFYTAIDPSDTRYYYGSYMFQPKDDDIKAITRSDKFGNEDTFKYRVKGINPSDTGNTPSDDPFYVPFAMDPNHSTTLYLATTRLYRTVNRGDKWAAIELKPPAAGGGRTPFSTGATWGTRITSIAVNPQDSEHVYVGTWDGRLFSLQRDPADDGWTSTESTTIPSKGNAGSVIADIGIPRTPASKNNVLVAVSSDHRGSTGFVVHSRILRSADKGGTWLPVAALPAVAIQGVPITDARNPVNAIVCDPRPGNEDNVYIGCNHGVFFSIDLGANWAQFNNGLPNVPIADMDFLAAEGLLRAATMGRSVWEVKVDDLNPLPQAAPYIRDNLSDNGTGVPVTGQPEPFDPDSQLKLTSSVDIKFDTPFPIFEGFETPESTVDYTSGGEADYVSFADFGNNDLRKNKESKIYLQIQNRGSQPVGDLKVRLFFNPRPGNVFPDLQADFWNILMDPDEAKFAAWKPIGVAKPVPAVSPLEPSIVSFLWTPPQSPFSTFGVLAVLTRDSDATTSVHFKIEDVLKNESRVAFRESELGMADVDFVVLGVLALAGLAVIGFGIANEI